MSKNIKGGKKVKEGEKGDGQCYFPCKDYFTRGPERVLIEATKNIIENMGTWTRDQMNTIPW